MYTHRRHQWTQTEIRFLEKKISGRSYAELTKLFNRHFHRRMRLAQILGACHNRGLVNGRVCGFKPGHKPSNKWKKGWCPPGSEKGWFKPGHKPWTYKPVGSERIDKDGYFEIKIAGPCNWKTKHLIVWEKAHGPKPKGHAVIFADRNKRNFRLSNLLLVSRAELCKMNQFGLISGDAGLTRAGKLIADISLLAAERKRGSVKKRRTTS